MFLNGFLSNVWECVFIYSSLWIHLFYGSGAPMRTQSLTRIVILFIGWRNSNILFPSTAWNIMWYTCVHMHPFPWKIKKSLFKSNSDLCRAYQLYFWNERSEGIVHDRGHPTEYRSFYHWMTSLKEKKKVSKLPNRGKSRASCILCRIQSRSVPVL